MDCGDRQKRRSVKGSMVEDVQKGRLAEERKEDPSSVVTEIEMGITSKEIWLLGKAESSCGSRTRTRETVTNRIRGGSFVLLSSQCRCISCQRTR